MLRAVSPESALFAQAFNCHWQRNGYGKIPLTVSVRVRLLLTVNMYSLGNDRS